ncbi:MAG: MYG1 family protein [Candidatus Pacebacteria bacterium]|nr:MYG1 family protein [Candidatus Paceibacterota bacterium]
MIPREKFSNEIWIGVHDGVFHMDDIFDTALHVLYYEQAGKISKIFRIPRGNKWLKDKMDCLIDFGNKNDEHNDDHHHLRGRKSYRIENGIPFAASGLGWDKIGLTVCNESVWIFEQIKQMYVLPIDAWDNGIFLNPPPIRKDGARIRIPSIFNIIDAWREDARGNNQKMDEYFMVLVDFFKKTLRCEINRLKK